MRRKTIEFVSILVWVISLPVLAQTSPEAVAVSLNDLVEEALRQNPAIQAARQALEAKRALILPARTLPDPLISFQTMGNLVPPSLQTGDPSSGRTLSIEQEVPYPGKLGLQGKIAETEAQAESWNYEQTRREVVAELKLAYYDLYLIHQSIETVQKDKSLLEDVARIADARYRVGQGLQQDVLKAQVEVSRLIDRLTVLEQQKGVAEAMLNRLLYRPTDTPMARPAPFGKATLRYSFPELSRLAETAFAPLKMQEREIDRGQYAVQLARKQFRPDFAFGFTYFNRSALPEMYGLMVSARLPLYYWRRQRPELASATASLLGAQKQRESIGSLLILKLKDAYLKATTSERLMELYLGGVIPQATLSFESATAGYQVGRVDFLTLVDNLVTLLEYELRYHQALTEYQKALAELEALVGAEVTR